jgi:predicted PP-loop superfamily ATPase
MNPFGPGRCVVNVATIDSCSSNFTCPILGRLVKEVHDLKILRMLLLQRIELLSKEDVLLGDI